MMAKNPDLLKKRLNAKEKEGEQRTVVKLSGLMFIAGFVVEDKDGDFFSFYNRAKCRVYQFAVTDEQYDDLCRVLEWFEENKHRVSYDIIGVIFRYIGISFKQKDRYVCTHFVGSVLKDSGIAPMINKPEELKPQDFETIANRISSKIIYEGFLRKIPRS